MTEVACALRCMLAGMEKLLLGLASLAGLLAGHVSCQEPRRTPVTVSDEELIERHGRGQPFWETKWQLRKDGALTQLPNPAAGGASVRGLSFIGDEFPSTEVRDALVRQLRLRVRSWPTSVDWLAPLLREPGDLLSATLTERHFSKLKRNVRDVPLRQFLILPGEPKTEPMARRELLERELAVRLIQRRLMRSARGELRALATGEGDALVRRAARDALAAMDGDTARPSVALQDLQLVPPAKADLWLWIDVARMPARGDIASALRKQRAEQLWQRVLGRGRGASEAILAGAQLVVDIPNELPFEMARLWGRARVDQCLLAFRVLDGQPDLLWAAASGAFEVGVLGDYLEALQVEVTVHGEVVKSTDWWPGFAVEVAPNHVVVRRDLADTAPAGAWPAFAAIAAGVGDVLAAKLPEDSEMQSLPWLLLERGDTAAVRLQPFALRVTTGASAARARERCESAAVHVASADPDRVLPSLPAQIATSWQAALRGAKVDASGEPGRLRVRVTGQKLDPFVLWPLLR